MRDYAVAGAFPAAGPAVPAELPKLVAGGGLGDLGGRPSMMSVICSASIVSHSSKAATIASTLSRFSSRIDLANAY